MFMRRAQADLLAVAQRRAALDPRAVQERPVGRAQVDQVQSPAVLDDHAMPDLKTHPFTLVTDMSPAGDQPGTIEALSAALFGATCAVVALLA